MLGGVSQAPGTALATPLLRDGVAIGAVVVRRFAGAGVHGAAGRAAGDVRGPGGHRHRERPAVLRVGAAHRRPDARRSTSRRRSARCCGCWPSRRRASSRCWTRWSGAQPACARSPRIGIWQVDGDEIERVASFRHGWRPARQRQARCTRSRIAVRTRDPRSRDDPHPRRSDWLDEFPDVGLVREWQASQGSSRPLGPRTVLAIPLRHEGEAIGALDGGSHRGPAVHRRRGPPAGSVRGPGGDCHRQHAAVPGAGERNRALNEALEQQTCHRRGPAGHRGIAQRPRPGPQGGGRECRAPLRDRRHRDPQRRGREPCQRRDGGDDGERRRLGFVRPLSRETIQGRAVIERRPVHVPDVLAVVDTEYPMGAPLSRRHGTRSALAVPCSARGSASGSIYARRNRPSAVQRDSRSRCWRRSRTRPSSRSRTPACSRSFRSAPPAHALGGRAGGARGGQPGRLVLAGRPGGADDDPDPRRRAFAGGRRDGLRPGRRDRRASGRVPRTG